jgi:hypothetical protein
LSCRSDENADHESGFPSGVTPVLKHHPGMVTPEKKTDDDPEWLQEIVQKDKR